MRRIVLLAIAIVLMSGPAIAAQVSLNIPERVVFLQLVGDKLSPADWKLKAELIDTIGMSEADIKILDSLQVDRYTGGLKWYPATKRETVYTIADRMIELVKKALEDRQQKVYTEVENTLLNKLASPGAAK